MLPFHQAELLDLRLNQGSMPACAVRPDDRSKTHKYPYRMLALSGVDMTQSVQEPRASSVCLVGQVGEGEWSMWRTPLGSRRGAQVPPCGSEPYPDTMGCVARKEEVGSAHTLGLSRVAEAPVRKGT
ncbi:hypothetical protein DPEC_G00297660 [Dallia pectoralis]|uniref:Uncharacterized protein n=1 Tax=Dallia pectoralis TaxID=75939 RepID=A0ACC2FFU6_DALPE|nr:hypothetical protein DPEC_G00297660 [Dallia pectoralis]